MEDSIPMSNMNKNEDRADGRRNRPNGVLCGVFGLAACAVLAFSLPSQAQDGGALWGRAGCADCHGPLAAGAGDPAYPDGPSLRRTRLDRDELIETISCGRPGTDMPYNLKGAYTEVACYGLPPGDMPGEVTGQGFLAAEELETLVDFLLEYAVGKRKITRENCAAFYGGNLEARGCLQY